MDNNAVIEPLFKTWKVIPRFPGGGVKCIDICREWTQQSVQLYSFRHRHMGTSWVIPAQRHEGLDVQILDNRSKVYADLVCSRQRFPLVVLDSYLGVKMKMSRFSDGQIVKILSSVTGGATVGEVCQSHTVSANTFYTWKRKTFGMESDDICKLKDHPSENQALK